MLHDAWPSFEAGTLRTGVPLIPWGGLPGGFIEMRLVGQVVDWTVELTGDPELVLAGGAFGLERVGCEAYEVGTLRAP